MQDVFIVDGARTPFLKVKGRPNQFSAADLAVQCGRPLLARQPFTPDAFDEVIIGCTMNSPDEANVARVISLRLGCGKKVPAWTVQRNCASGLQAIDCAISNIALGRSQLVLAGGTEAMSRAPLLFNDKMVNFFADLSGAKSLGARLKAFASLRPSFLKPVIALLCGLTDPVVKINMGQTAEEIVYKFGLKRSELDHFAVTSHKKAQAAIEKHYRNEIVPIYAPDGKVIEVDDGVRADSNFEKLSTLKPVFEKYGNITAANSSQITDGAGLLIFANADMVKKYNLKVLAKVVDTHWAGLEPEIMGLGPVHAITPLLQKNNLGLSDIDIFEINEAFAAQVIGCKRAWQDDKYCQEQLGLDKAFGDLDMNKLNIDGGAIAIGHPIGASGARIVLHAIEALKRTGGKLGVASLCIGGGQGGAILIERINAQGETL